MKNLLPLLTLALAFCSSQSYARKSPVVKIEIANKLADFYIVNRSPLHFKFTREDGTIAYSRGYKYGKVSWNKLFIKSNQARLYERLVYVNHQALKKNNYKLELEIYFSQGARSFSQTIVYELPRITHLDIVQDSIAPYTWYKKTVRITTTEQTYNLHAGASFKSFSFEDFEWQMDARLEQEGNMFRYIPRQKTSATQALRISVKNPMLGLQDVKDVPITALKHKSFEYIANKGSNGANGEDGESGGTGEHGGNGGGGWHGADGDEGKHIEIIIASYTKKQLKVVVFVDNERQIYYLPLNTTISLSAIGGQGGRGGNGGDGGSGGSSSDEYEAGDDGAGGPGGNGGDGGLGGYVQVFSDLELLRISQILTVNTTGGAPGKGGSGGSGSPSGTGGKLGKQGRTGTVAYQIISTQELQRMMQELDL